MFRKRLAQDTVTAVTRRKPASYNAVEIVEHFLKLREIDAMAQAGSGESYENLVVLMDSIGNSLRLMPESKSVDAKHVRAGEAMSEMWAERRRLAISDGDS